MDTTKDDKLISTNAAIIASPYFPVLGIQCQLCCEVQTTDLAVKNTFFICDKCIKDLRDIIIERRTNQQKQIL
jgi:hypothetical protein